MEQLHRGIFWGIGTAAECISNGIMAWGFSSGRLLLLSFARSTPFPFCYLAHLTRSLAKRGPTNLEGSTINCMSDICKASDHSGCKADRLGSSLAKREVTLTERKCLICKLL